MFLLIQMIAGTLMAAWKEKRILQAGIVPKGTILFLYGAKVKPYTLEKSETNKIQTSV